MNAHSPAARHAPLMTSNVISGSEDLRNLKPESMRTYVTLVTLVSFYFIIMAGNFEEELLDDSVIDIRTIEFQLFMFEPMLGSSNDSDRSS